MLALRGKFLMEIDTDLTHQGKISKPLALFVVSFRKRKHAGKLKCTVDATLDLRAL